jgi:hypothetical protein
MSEWKVVGGLLRVDDGETIQNAVTRMAVGFNEVAVARIDVQTS